jgi:ABC-type sugar transport system substrate-binding protein
MNEAISRGFDAIILHPVDPAGASPAVLQAREKGIVVLNIQTDTIQRPTIKHGWNWYDNGVITANWMGEQLGGEGKVVGMTGVAGTSHGDGRTAGFQDTIAASWPGIEIVDWAEGAGYTQEGGYDIAETLLRRHSDIVAIAGLEDQQAIGARRAATDLGRSEGLIVTGADGQREGQQAVADGILDMSVMMTRGFGPEALGAVDMLEAMLRGNVHGNAISAAHFPPQMAVTAANIAEQWQSPI